MSYSLTLETLGWIPVVWLVTTQLFVERGRLPRDGVALRLAACGAALVVVTVAALAGLWPVAALGLLWLRTEVFAHQHPIHEFRAHREQVRRERAQQEENQREQARLAYLEENRSRIASESVRAELAHHAIAHPGSPDGRQLVDDGPRRLSQGHANPGQSDRTQKTPGPPRPRAGHGVGGDRRPPSSSGRAPVVRQKKLGERVLDAIFKLEVVTMVIVALVLFGLWTQHQHISFGRNANSSLCRFMINGC